MIGGEDSKRHISGKIAYLDSFDVASGERVFGERRLLACGCRQLAGNIFAQRTETTKMSRQAAETGRLAACAPRRQPTAAITFSSIAMGVGNAVTSTVVRVGFGLPSPAKYTA